MRAGRSEGGENHVGSGDGFRIDGLFAAVPVREDGTVRGLDFREEAEGFTGVCIAPLGDLSVHDKGEGVETDIHKAAYYYQQGVDYGSDPEDLNEFRETLDASDIYDIGDLFYYGNEGFEQSYENAVDWYKVAAEKDYRPAQCDLGLMYRLGRGVEQDYDTALTWYRKAANQGSAVGQYNVGFFYYKGWGVDQNYSQALYWTRKAADQDYDAAQNLLGLMYEFGNGVTQSYTEAVSWYRKAADQGLASAQYNIGDCYEQGNGVKKDLQTAIYWYKKAASQDNDAAKDALVRLNVSWE